MENRINNNNPRIVQMGGCTAWESGTSPLLRFFLRRNTCINADVDVEEQR